MVSFLNTNTLDCNSCDSSYKISFSSVEVDGSPSYCPFCGSEIELDEFDEIMEDDFDIEEIFEEE